jgi:HAD superfamily phosphatase (TIGR01668 family)
MLRELLRPSWMVPGTLAEMPLDVLVEHQVTALVLDVDRTLLPRRQSVMPELALQWLNQAKQRMPIHLLSNNPSRARIGAVAKELGLPFTTAAGKPRRSALRRVLEQFDLPAEQVALVGDRLFTDVIVGNRLGLYTVLVKPIDPLGRPCRKDHLQRLELRLARWVGTALG